MVMLPQSGKEQTNCARNAIACRTLCGKSFDRPAMLASVLYESIGVGASIRL